MWLVGFLWTKLELIIKTDVDRMETKGEEYEKQISNFFTKKLF